MLNKNEIARMLATSHRGFEPGIRQIYRVISDREDEDDEPVKLLEVNPDTSPSGIVPIAFGADPPRVPFPSVVIEVTEEEFKHLNLGALALPDGWRLGESLLPSTA